MQLTNSTTKTDNPTPKTASFLTKHGSKLLGLGFWLMLLGGYGWYVKSNDLTAAAAAEQLANLLATSAIGPILYIIIYWLRPLIFFPATILTLLGGFLFGPIGILYVVVGANGSAMVAYLVGRFFGEGVLEEQENSGLIQQYAQRMRDNSFETILLMRLIFLPYDLVNYASGFLRIRWFPFLLATAIGSIPGTISFVLLSASFGTVDELLAGEFKLNPGTLIFSIALVAVSIAISQYLKRREA